jgi:hypothetical protein
METEHNIRLTSTEISALWSSYMANSMAVCVLKYFLEKVEDTQIRPVIEYGLELSQNHVQRITDIFKHEKFPIPQGFTDEDINVTAPRLFSDTFQLIYMKNMSRIGMITNSSDLSTSARSDVCDFLTECLASSAELYNKSIKVLLSKGVHVRAPSISTPEKVDFVTKQGFLTGFLGERRTLNAIEITHLFTNVETNDIGKAIITGFSQVAKSKQVRQYMIRGRDISAKHIEVFSSLLMEDHLPAPMIWDTGLMDSTVNPFSDKLMMSHIASLSAAGIGNYGVAISASQRRDLGVTYSRLLSEISQYAEDGANIVIENE